MSLKSNVPPPVLLRAAVAFALLASVANAGEVFAPYAAAQYEAGGGDRADLAGALNTPA